MAKMSSLTASPSPRMRTDERTWHAVTIMAVEKARPTTLKC